MTRKLMTGNGAAAWGARLAEADYIPAFPITPQTEIIENLALWTDSGEMDARMVTLESEHSMITAAGAAAVTGVRVFTATSSQGLLYGMEMLYTAAWQHPLPWNRITTISWPLVIAAFFRSMQPTVRKLWMVFCWHTDWERICVFDCLLL
jgi:hypothetical protein